MLSLLLPVIYLAFISMGLPDSMLGSAWPSMYTGLGVGVSACGLISTIITASTVVSSLLCDRLHARFGTGRIQHGNHRPVHAGLFAEQPVLDAVSDRRSLWAGRGQH